MRPKESFIEQPVRSLQTMLRVLAEEDRRLPGIVPDGIYGPTTMNAVSAFQRQQGLPSTGIADQRTWETIVAQYEPALIRIDKAQPIEVIIDPGEVFRRGDKNPYIYLLQAMLSQLSDDHPNISHPGNNGTLTEQTANSLADFQQIAGLPVTGELDKITWKHLVHQFTLNAHHNKTKINE